MSEMTMLQLVAFTIALVEGVKQSKLPAQYYTLSAMVIGGGLAAIAEFAPEIWLRVIPILTVGLAAAGLYSIGKRAGSAIVSR